jgi:hypothetical protein
MRAINRHCFVFLCKKNAHAKIRILPELNKMCLPCLVSVLEKSLKYYKKVCKFIF